MDNDIIILGKCRKCKKDTAIDKNRVCGECEEKMETEFFKDILKQFDKVSL